jgi:hypothetical protein
VHFFFHFSAIIVLPFWALMIFLPKWPMTEKIIASPWIIVPPAFCYAGLLLPNLSIDLLSFFQGPSPESLASIMARPWAASLFWAYAGAFDLFVGRWIFFDYKKRGLNHLFIAPILVVAIIFGPIAFLFYGLICLILPKAKG